MAGAWRGKKKKKSASLGALQLEGTLAADRKPAYLLLGAEDFLREEALAGLRRALLGDVIGPSYQVFDGTRVELATVLDEVRTLPFFGAGHRLVIVERAGPNGNAKGFLAEHGDRLATFLASPPETSTLVFVAPKLDKRYKSIKAVAAKLFEVDCGPYDDDSALLRFLRLRAKHWGRPFARGADVALLERLGGQEIPLTQIDSEVRKLAAAGTGEIKVQDIEALASQGSHADSFALINKIARGDTEGALLCLREMLRDGMVSSGGQRVRDANGIAMILLPTIRWDLSRLLKARAALDRGEQTYEITKALRVFRDKSLFMERCRGADRDALGARHAILRRADA
ncbi:MAG: DNA polymerase III subunit delta, partial [Planctomycetes bacterium]|nr:DNA polymerase III subunit delta [Planctomycetota bacterium]